MEEDNYVFGSLGKKMQNISPKFILEAMMMSLIFLILGDLAWMIYSIFFTSLNLALKIISSVSSFFGAILMIAILISTFQSWKQISMIIDIQSIAKPDNEIKSQEVKNA